MKKTRISVKVIPKSSSNSVEILEDGIKVKLTKAPEKGKANKMLIDILSKLLKIPKSNLKIVAGETSRNKLILVEGLEKEQVFKILSKNLDKSRLR